MIVCFCLDVTVCFCLDVIVCFCLDGIVCFGLHVSVCFCLNGIVCFCLDGIVCFCLDGIVCLSRGLTCRDAFRLIINVKRVYFCTFIVTFTTLGRHPYPEQYKSEKFPVKDLAQWPRSGSLVVLRFELTTLQIVCHFPNHWATISSYSYKDLCKSRVLYPSSWIHLVCTNRENQ